MDHSVSVSQLFSTTHEFIYAVKIREKVRILANKTAHQYKLGLSYLALLRKYYF